MIVDGQENIKVHFAGCEVMNQYYAVKELGVNLSDPATYEDFRTACHAFSDCAINYYTKLESQSEEYCTIHKM